MAAGCEQSQSHNYHSTQSKGRRIGALPPLVLSRPTEHAYRRKEHLGQRKPGGNNQGWIVRMNVRILPVSILGLYAESNADNADRTDQRGFILICS